LEGIIGENVGAFYEVGNALREIRDQDLYKLKNGGGYQSFEAYCKGEWDYRKSHAYRLIGSAQIVDVLSPLGDIHPTTETQVRPLSRLKPDQQLIVWAKAEDRSDRKGDVGFCRSPCEKTYGG
jgi:hypothetical protein